MQKNQILPLLMAVILLLNESSATVDVITGLISRNAVGIPMLHQNQHWPFDPEAGIRRSAVYERENGYRGEKLIERLGLGVDGNQEQRLYEQRIRDEGHLGGLNYYRP